MLPAKHLFNKVPVKEGLGCKVLVKSQSWGSNSQLTSRWQGLVPKQNEVAANDLFCTLHAALIMSGGLMLSVLASHQNHNQLSVLVFNFIK